MTVVDYVNSARAREAWLARAPNGWHETRLRYLVGRVDAGDWGSEPVGFGDARVVRAADFDREHLVVDTNNLPIRHIAVGKLRALRLERGDLVLEKSGGGEEAPVGLAVLFDHDLVAVPSNFAARVRPAPGIDPAFLRYVFAALYYMRLNERSIKQTTGIQNIDVWSFLDERCVAPDSSAVQRRIAAHLDAETQRIDDLVNAKARHLSALDERLDAYLMTRVLGGSGDVGSGKSPSGLYRNVPSEWSEVHLWRLGCDVQTGPFGSQLHASDYVEGGWPVVNPMNLVNGSIVAAPKVAISSEKRSDLARQVLRAGDVVLARRGVMGRAALVGDGEAGWVCGTGCMLIRIRKGASLQSAYLTLMLQTAPARAYFEAMSVGSTMDNLNQETVRSFPALLPPADVQRQIVADVAAYKAATAHLTNTIRRQLGLLSEYRRALIAAAVTGVSRFTGAGDP